MNSEPNIEQRLRTMRTLWIALLLTIGFYFLFCMFRGRAEGFAPNNTLFLVLVGVSLAITLMSFLIKSRLVSRAIEQQQVQQVQQAYIVGWAMNEVAALLGIVDFIATGDRYYYVMFIISACAQLLHYPRREDVVNAGFKSAL